MTAKEYLQQIRVLDTKIKQKQEQYKRLEELASSPGGIRYDKAVTQVSKTGDRLERLVLQYIQLGKEIEEELLKFETTKQTIINQIQGLNEDRYMNVLFKRYVEYKSYKSIAVEMMCSIENVYVIHRKALNAFSQIIVNYT